MIFCCLFTSGTLLITNRSFQYLCSIIYKFYGDTSLKRNFRAAVNVTY